MGDKGVETGQHVVWAFSAGERVSRDESDVAVITNDAGQRDGVEVSPLSAGEYSLPLPPKPQKTKTDLTFLSCRINLCLVDDKQRI